MRDRLCDKGREHCLNSYLLRGGTFIRNFYVLNDPFPLLTKAGECQDFLLSLIKLGAEMFL